MGGQLRLHHVLNERTQGGFAQPHLFRRTLSSSGDLLRRLQLAGTLDGHAGCVNTVSWNTSGEVLVSGSDDQRVVLWDWQRGKALYGFDTGHTGNVFQAHMVAPSERVMVTCAADGAVRVHSLGEDGCRESREAGQHRGRAHKLAIGDPPMCFLSAGEDGWVQGYDLRGPDDESTIRMLIRNEQNGVVGLNTIAYNPRKPGWEVAVAGDDPLIRIFDVRRIEQDNPRPGARTRPTPVRTEAPADVTSGPQRRGGRRDVTSVAWSHTGDLLGSYGGDHVYLFARQGYPEAGGGQDLPEDRVLQVFKGHRNSMTVKGVSFFGLSDEYVISGSDCGRIFFWDKNSGRLLQLVHGDEDVVNCLAPHPHLALHLATSGIDSTAKLWAPTAQAPTFDRLQADELVESNMAARREMQEEQYSSNHLTPEFLMRVFLFARQTQARRRRRRGADQREHMEEPSDAMFDLRPDNHLESEDDEEDDDDDDDDDEDNEDDDSLREDYQRFRDVFLQGLVTDDDDNDDDDDDAEEDHEAFGSDDDDDDDNEDDDEDLDEEHDEEKEEKEEQEDEADKHTIVVEEAALKVENNDGFDGFETDFTDAEDRTFQLDDFSAFHDHSAVRTGESRLDDGDEAKDCAMGIESKNEEGEDRFHECVSDLSQEEDNSSGKGNSTMKLDDAVSQADGTEYNENVKCGKNAANDVHHLEGSLNQGGFVNSWITNEARRNVIADHTAENKSTNVLHLQRVEGNRLEETN